MVYITYIYLYYAYTNDNNSKYPLLGKDPIHDHTWQYDPQSTTIYVVLEYGSHSIKPIN